MITLQDKTALVTGAARGLGRAIALALARAGMDVAFIYRASSGAARDLVKDVEALGRRAYPIQADLSAHDAAEQVRERLLAQRDELYLLVNNASRFEPSPLGQLRVEDFDAAMAVNARAPLLLSQACAPLLGARYQSTVPGSAGRIVNLIDIHVLGEPLPRFVAYNASKAALLEITMSCAVELAPRVTVNAIAPGAITWPSFYSAEQSEAFLARIPLQRAGLAEECAAAVVFLARDASYCTGQVIRIDGGRALT
ncbi:MAG: SDR family oxidoreductase [Gammaproteobacteria bacterium]